MEIIKCEYNRKTNKSSFTIFIQNQNYILSFDSNPILEVEIINLHKKNINDLFILLEKILINKEYDYKTLEEIKNLYNLINKNIEKI